MLCHLLLELSLNISHYSLYLYMQVLCRYHTQWYHDLAALNISVTTHQRPSQLSALLTIVFTSAIGQINPTNEYSFDQTNAKLFLYFMVIIMFISISLQCFKSNHVNDESVITLVTVLILSFVYCCHNSMTQTKSNFLFSHFSISIDASGPC